MKVQVFVSGDKVSFISNVVSDKYTSLSEFNTSVQEVLKNLVNNVLSKLEDKTLITQIPLTVSNYELEITYQV